MMAVNQWTKAVIQWRVKVRQSHATVTGGASPSEHLAQCSDSRRRPGDFDAPLLGVVVHPPGIISDSPTAILHPQMQPRRKCTAAHRSSLPEAECVLQHGRLFAIVHELGTHRGA